MTWNDAFRAAVPLPERAQFLVDLQALVASVRVGRPPVVTDLLRAHADLALAYLDDGDKKEQARSALQKR